MADAWTLDEVEAIVADYFDMLAHELADTSFNKTRHRQELSRVLLGRSDASIEFKHANISAALVDLGFQYIDGYKPRFNYQELLADVVERRLRSDDALRELARASAERPTVVPEVDDMLGVLTDAPGRAEGEPLVRDFGRSRRGVLGVDYLELETRNRSLGEAGELFVIEFERARLARLGRSDLADAVEHTSKVRGDAEGFDIRSFEEDGRDRLVEVKTTKYGQLTPFFVTRNEVETSERHVASYHVYRLFGFQRKPRMFHLPGSIRQSCRLEDATYLAHVS